VDGSSRIRNAVNRVADAAGGKGREMVGQEGTLYLLLLPRVAGSLFIF